MKFILTGTRVYGPAREDSDVDIVMGLEDHIELSVCLAELGIKTYATVEQLDYGSGYYFELGEIKVNIIGIPDEELEGWAVATRMMAKLDPVQDRDDRIAMFAGMRDAALEEMRDG